jgi:hypothetical protein
MERWGAKGLRMNGLGEFLKVVKRRQGVGKKAAGFE